MEQDQSGSRIVLPTQVVEKLHLKRGDKVEIAFSDKAECSYPSIWYINF